MKLDGLCARCSWAQTLPVWHGEHKLYDELVCIYNARGFPQAKKCFFFELTEDQVAEGKADEEFVRHMPIL